MHARTRAAGLVAGATLALGTIGGLAPATAGEPPAPCAKQQAQVDKAEDALVRVTAVFERQQDEVKKAKHEVEAADTATERRAARRDLAKSRDAKADAKVTQRAQQQRLAKAQQRLDACESDAAETAAG